MIIDRLKNAALYKNGMFVIFFPEDAHNPCQQYQSSSQVLKVVVKVLATTD